MKGNDFMSGIKHFSGFEVVRAAMEVEKNGHRFYSEMALKASDSTVQQLFTWLAQDEVEHLRRLNQLAEKYSDGSFSEYEEDFLPYLNRFSDTEIFPSAERLEAILKTGSADVQSLDLAIEAEEKFAEYFHQAAAIALTPEGQEAFSWLAGEEERHALVLRERRDQLCGQCSGCD
ncbi:MAG: ferritin family protein [Desulfuromonadales bacterium]|nr:ferritin family protein [Desulfuromonadales bacterium]